MNATNAFAQFGVGEEECGSGMVQDVSDFAGGQAGVDGDEYASG